MVELPRGHYHSLLLVMMMQLTQTRLEEPMSGLLDEQKVSHQNGLLRLVGHQTGATTNGFLAQQFDSEEYNSDPVSSYL